MLTLDDYEIWVAKAPQMADHIKTPRAGNIYTHHGIYISDDEVINFASEDSDNLAGISNEIISSDLKTFLKGGELLVREYTAQEETLLFSPDQIVSYARSCQGDAGYNLVFNNCEHFCNKCLFDQHRSKQVERFVKIPKKGGNSMGFLDKIGSIIEKVNTKRRILEEPSKVEIAEIERQKAVQLAELDNAKVLLSSECEAELNKFNAKLAMTLMQAQTEQFGKVYDKMVEIGKEVQKIEIEKFLLLENSNLEVQEKINGLYDKSMTRISDLEDDFFNNKYPKLIINLKQFEDNPVAKEMSENTLTMYLHNFLERIQSEAEMIRSNQKLLRDSSIKSKEKTQVDSTRFAHDRMDMIKEVLGNSININSLLDKRETSNLQQLPESSNKKLKLRNPENNELPQIETRIEKD